MMATFARGPRPVRERPGDGRVPRAGAGRALPRLDATRSRTSSRPSTGRRSPTTPASSSGATRAASTPPSAPTRSGSSGSPSTRRRRSTPPSTRSCASSSLAARPSCPTSSPDRRGPSLRRMELQQAMDFIRAERQGVLTTIRRDGRPQLSNIVYAVDADGDDPHLGHREPRQDEEPRPRPAGVAVRVPRELLGLRGGRRSGRAHAGGERPARRDRRRAGRAVPRRSRASTTTGTTTAPRWSPTAAS